MKKKNGILIMITCLSLLISSIMLPAYATHSRDDGGSILESMYTAQQEEVAAIDDEMILQGQLNELAQAIANSMQEPTSTYVDGAFAETRYSDAYAGSYIDGDVLVVCVTRGEAMNQIDSPLVSYRLVENSYSELLDCKSTLTAKYQDLYHVYASSSGEEFVLLDSIAGFGVDEELNAVIVDIAGLTDEKAALFEALFEVSENLIFQEVGATNQLHSSYKPGVGICVITGRNGSTIEVAELSMGYRAYRTTSSGTEYGFATCAHGIKDSIDGKVYEGNVATVIGTISDWEFGGSVDASFVKLKTGNSIVMTTMYSNDKGSTTGGDEIEENWYMSRVVKGSTVNKVGATTYKTQAKVTAENYDTTIEGTAFTNMTKTEGFSDHGDSGGMVYMYNNGSYKPAGLIMGGGGTWIFSHSIYVKAQEVINEMNVWPY